ncbi:hypothetical protein DTO006G1_4399 [Penicillium roqueforti]|uniref:uncharacterized protein n=1 Tax=Penicillium roqueforti TaxID=5082 RepID=UPI00190DF442|nr:uncharacterized protein LCP9604111_5027 [Penicillium roqueforti]KAF9248788.1 hypothetical protein LCP9604111_5027 [Penicillium roqueforti]KAI1831664.1 hypothetical protein CBS147337_7474 [Penicillium roqueforti]KAI2681657.1 hypothetical protein CBS147355_2867 [Penicillium roqueforti]KAI2689046.1 hypothetical protein LCP963914a_2135 [Penicillium roqueforti]KAI2719193.1 hypothetical protein CBS147318_4303 [Penicillium roqueforti]
MTIYRTVDFQHASTSIQQNQERIIHSIQIQLPLFLLSAGLETGFWTSLFTSIINFARYVSFHSDLGIGLLDRHSDNLRDHFLPSSSSGIQEKRPLNRNQQKQLSFRRKKKILGP